MSDVDSHHTPAEVDKAFAYAPTILRKLVEAGVDSPRFELYPDASGSLLLGRRVTKEQYELASKLVYSLRSIMSTKEAGIIFCCGLVTAAERDGA